MLAVTKGRVGVGWCLVLFGVAGAAALAAGVEFFFTDWNDDRAALQVGPGGVAVSGTF